jgi:DNA-binding NtrC family response regulator
MSDAVDETTQILKLDLPEAPTVLIVDDDELVLARLKELVTAAGYAVRTAATGADALKVLEQAAASIVITDLNMPDMNGLDANLYASKARGRNCVTLSNSHGSHLEVLEPQDRLRAS